MDVLWILLLMIVLMVLKVPVAFSMLASAILALVMQGTSLALIPQRFFGSLNSFSLLAIPLFIFIGSLMNTAGITKRIFEFARAYVRHIKGGLGHVNVIASVIFAGMTGSAVSDSYGLGLIEIKAMTDEGYDPDFSAAVTGASSVIGPIIPPSIPMVVYAMIAEQSVGKMFLGGILPGLLLGISMMILVYFISRKRNYRTEPKETWGNRLRITLKALPALLVPVLMLAGMTLGVVTPTEGGIIALAYALLLGFFVYKELTWKIVWETLKKTVADTCSILLIIASASVLAYVITTSGIPELVENILMSVSGGNMAVVLLIINVILLIAGCFMEGTAIIMLLAPIFLPVVQALGMDLVQFGVMLVLNVTIGIVTPPVGLCLYITSEIAQISFDRVVKATLPFLIPLVGVLLITTFVPFVSTWLPSLML